MKSSTKERTDPVKRRSEVRLTILHRLHSTNPSYFRIGTSTYIRNNCFPATIFEERKYVLSGFHIAKAVDTCAATKRKERAADENQYRAQDASQMHSTELLFVPWDTYQRKYRPTSQS